MGIIPTTMPIGRAERFNKLRPHVTATFGARGAATVFAVLELTEMAWHDCYGEIGPPAEVLDDILICAEGDLVKLVMSARDAVIDWRDVRLRAERLRAETSG